MTPEQIKEMMQKPAEELVSTEMARAMTVVCEAIDWKKLSVGTPEHFYLYGGDL